MNDANDHFPRTPVHSFGESLEPQPRDYAELADRPARKRPYWCKAALAVMALIAVAVAPTLFAAFLFVLFHQVSP